MLVVQHDTIRQMMQGKDGMPIEVTTAIVSSYDWCGVVWLSLETLNVETSDSFICHESLNIAKED